MTCKVSGHTLLILSILTVVLLECVNTVRATVRPPSLQERLLRGESPAQGFGSRVTTQNSESGSLQNEVPSLKVGAFNIRNFGNSKLGKSWAVEVIVKVKLKSIQWL